MATHSRRLERKIELLVFNSRWLLVPLYMGLIFALILYALNFLKKLYELTSNFVNLSSTDFLLTMLTLVDKVLVSNLIVMVIIGGYESSVSKINIDGSEDKLSWLGKLDAGSLKIKLGISIISISSVHLLKSFMNLGQLTNTELWWLVVIHMVFVFSALLLVWMDSMEVKTKKMKLAKPGKLAYGDTKDADAHEYGH